MISLIQTYDIRKYNNSFYPEESDTIFNSMFNNDPNFRQLLHEYSKGSFLKKDTYVKLFKPGLDPHDIIKFNPKYNVEFWAILTEDYKIGIDSDISYKESDMDTQYENYKRENSDNIFIKYIDERDYNSLITKKEMKNV